jgi:hypothetical protein
VTWFAVPNDEVGGWAVADRQVRRSQLDTRRTYRSAGPGIVEPVVEQRDRVVADMVDSQEDARRIAAALNFMDSPYDSAGEHPGWEAVFIGRYSVPWPEAKEEA